MQNIENFFPTCLTRRCKYRKRDPTTGRNSEFVRKEKLFEKGLKKYDKAMDLVNILNAVRVSKLQNKFLLDRQ